MEYKVLLSSEKYENQMEKCYKDFHNFIKFFETSNVFFLEIDLIYLRFNFKMIF